METIIRPGDLVELFDVNYGGRTIGMATETTNGHYRVHTIMVGTSRFRSEGTLRKV
jgi:hypothetical protein